MITNYFEGIYYGDTEKLETVFHENAELHGDIGGAEYRKNVPDYLEGVKGRRSPKELGESFNMKTLGIDIIGNIAMAKLQLPMLGYNYFDYLSLAKIDGRWKIVGKIFAHME